MSVFKTIARIAGIGATVYGGYAAFTWLRYGKRKVEPQSPLDRFLPDAEVSERHCIGVNAPTDVTYEACCMLDATKQPVAHALFDTRAIALGAKPVHADLPATLVEQFKTIGWSVLEEAPGREIVFGGVTKPWLADAGFRPTPATEFTDFAEPGWVKIVFNIAVEPVAKCCTLVTTETRAMATDADSRKKFRRYWAFVNPGVKIIRRTMLHAIKAQAETRVKTSLKRAVAAA